MATDRAYHHGDLRSALLARALEVVESDGHEAVSLRAMAEQLGVSRGAPYRHFPERDQLLAEIASVGFKRLDDYAADESARPAGPVEQLADAARRFLHFVDHHPQLFRLMYDSGLLQRADAFPQLAAAQREVYGKIVALYAAASGQQDQADSGLQARVIAFWSAIFGYAKLRQASLLQPYMMGALSAAEIESQVIRTAIGPDIVA
jgi:AcrR family transcriptional regulator